MHLRILALDPEGLFGTVRSELELMQRYQDLSGKIFHEISTSGSVHYDASDATPLYIMLAAHYLRASGDTAFIRASWPKIGKAMEYLFDFDRSAARSIARISLSTPSSSCRMAPRVCAMSPSIIT